jgi:exosortase family protein XrtM
MVFVMASLSEINSPSRLLVKALLFLILFGLLNMTYQAGRDGLVGRVLIDRMTVSVSGWLIGELDPAEHIRAQGHRLISPKVRLSVLNGCEGTDVMLLLCAALMVFPMSWRQRIRGIIGGILLIYVINQVRIVTLYYSLRYYRSLFDPLHSFVAPSVIVALSVLYFLCWTSHASRKEHI